MKAFNCVQRNRQSSGILKFRLPTVSSLYCLGKSDGIRSVLPSDGNTPSIATSDFLNTALRARCERRLLFQIVFSRVSPRNTARVSRSQYQFHTRRQWRCRRENVFEEPSNWPQGSRITSNHLRPISHPPCEIRSPCATLHS